ncbi:porin [Variovorax sp. J22R133]|uniref:porin n=1 Tax=Variovorax brevis TaxID=3053503 RepID=UPI002574F90A|nr:porin [Variovorax sp. J22R133]MDM0110789.1 porin [Variovorax sp. J22R133]
MKTKNKLRWCAAVGGLLTLPAYAQFDYGLYGVADLSYARFEPSGFEPDYRFNSNSLSPTFVGVKASYGFESGWTTGMALESFFRFQDMKFGRNDDDPFLSRENFVSLSHRDYGLLRVGRLQSLLFNTTVRFNALGNSTFSPSVRQLFTAGNLIGVQGDFYWNEAIGYTTPNFDGITGGLMAARGEKSNPGRLYGGTVVMAKGLFAGSLSAQRVDIDDGFNDPTLEDTWQLGASYNLGLAKLFGQYTHTRDKGLEVNSDIVSVGASIPLGPGTVQAQIATAKADGIAVSRKQTTTSAAYVWAYDSLTDFYVIAMDDRVRGQTRGFSIAVGVRYNFNF